MQDTLWHSHIHWMILQLHSLLQECFTTLSVEIYSRARRGVSLEINALSALVFLFSLVLVIGYYFISRDNSANHRRQGKQVRKELLR